MNVAEAIEAAEHILPGYAAEEGKIDFRWQAIIRVGTFIDAEPEAVWDFVSKWGSHRDSDIRDAIATCLLEHLLERHFDALFPRAEALVRADAQFADTFSRCWAFGKSELLPNRRRFEKLGEEARARSQRL